MPTMPQAKDGEFFTAIAQQATNWTACRDAMEENPPAPSASAKAGTRTANTQTKCKVSRVPKCSKRISPFLSRVYASLKTRHRLSLLSDFITLQGLILLRVVCLRCSTLPLLIPLLLAPAPQVRMRSIMINSCNIDKHSYSLVGHPTTRGRAAPNGPTDHPRKLSYVRLISPDVSRRS